jgi:hypothetical protein
VSVAFVAVVVVVVEAAVVDEPMLGVDDAFVADVVVVAAVAVVAVVAAVEGQSPALRMGRATLGWTERQGWLIPPRLL